MSVEAVPSPAEAEAEAEAEAPATLPTSTAFESEIVTLLREQNALLRKLLAAMRPQAPNSNIAKAKAIAASVPPTDGAPYVAVNIATGEYAVGWTMVAAADALGAPPYSEQAVLRFASRLLALVSVDSGPSWAS